MLSTCQQTVLFVAGVKKAVGNYEELAKDSDVDIVYVSNIHPAHKDTTLLMLEHGKHVLCEKPLAVRLCLLSPAQIPFTRSPPASQHIHAGIWQA